MTTVALLPSQLWFLEALGERMVHPGRWTLSKVYRLAPGTTEQTAAAAVARLWEHHDSLRARFHRRDGAWTQEIGAPDDPAPFLPVDLSSVPPVERSALISRLASDVAASIGLTGGPVVRFLFASAGPDEAPRLAFIAHHLALDYFSFRVVTADLGTALRSLRTGTPVSLPRGPRFAECVEALQAFAEAEGADELEEWFAQPWQEAARPPAAPRPGNALRLWRTRSRRSELSSPEHPAADLALGATGAAITEWTGGPTWVRSVHHGRDLVTRDGRQVLPSRVWRTTGWFALAGLRLLPAYQGQDLDAYTRSLAAGSQPPNRGVGLTLLHWAKPLPEAVGMVEKIMDDSRILFDYSSVSAAHPGTAAEIGDAPESMQGYHDLLEPRLDLHVRVRYGDGNMTVHWDFDPTVHPEQEVDALAGRADRLISDLTS